MGAASNSSRSLGGAEGDAGATNTPPPSAGKQTHHTATHASAQQLTHITHAHAGHALVKQ